LFFRRNEIHGQNPRAHEQKRKHIRRGKNIFTQEEPRKQGSRNGNDEIIDAELSDGIAFEKHAPERNGNGRNRGEIQQNQNAVQAYRKSPSVPEKPRYDQKKTADQQIVSRHGQTAVEAAGSFIDHGTENEKDARNQNKAFSEKMKPGKFAARKASDRHPGKPQRASRKLSEIQAVVGIDEMRKKDRRKRGRGIDDRAGSARRIGKSDIKENVLQKSIGNAEQNDIQQIIFTNAGRLSSADGINEQDNGTRKKKPNPRIQNFRKYAVGNSKIFISQFDHRKRASE